MLVGSGEKRVDPYGFVGVPTSAVSRVCSARAIAVWAEDKITCEGTPKPTVYTRGGKRMKTYTRTCTDETSRFFCFRRKELKRRRAFIVRFFVRICAGACPVVRVTGTCTNIKIFRFLKYTHVCVINGGRRFECACDSVKSK